MGENDPKYDHWIDREAKGMTSGRNIADRCTSEVPGVDGAKSAEASPVGKQDYLRGATVKERDGDPWEAECKPEIEQLGYKGESNEQGKRKR